MIIDGDLKQLAMELAMTRKGNVDVTLDMEEARTSYRLACTDIGDLEMISLASSSKGNCTLIRTPKTAVLVDVGISARRVAQGLADVGLLPRDLSGIFLTHEHRDHVLGLATMLKQWRLPVFTKSATWRALNSVVHDYSACQAKLNNDMLIGDLSVEYFPISHDAVDPVGFVFSSSCYRAGVCTDLGKVSDMVIGSLAESDLLLLEANHDLDMLWRGPYTMRLKERVGGAMGHLSNGDAGKLISRLYRGRALKVILGHRSEHNNTTFLVDETVRAELSHEGLIGGSDPVDWCHGAVLGNVKISVNQEVEGVNSEK